MELKFYLNFYLIQFNSNSTNKLGLNWIEENGMQIDEKFIENLLVNMVVKKRICKFCENGLI